MIPGGDPGHVAPATHAGARARSCLLPGHVAGAVNRPGGRSIRRRSWTRPRRPRPRRRSPAACCRIAPTARAAPLLPLPPSAIRATPRRAPGRAAPRHATRHRAGATRPRMQPLRGCFYRATRNASALRIRAPPHPHVTRRVPPRAPAPLRSRRAARPPARSCTRAPASACRYCARHFPLSRALGAHHFANFFNFFMNFIHLDGPKRPPRACARG